jgi:transposase
VLLQLAYLSVTNVFALLRLLPVSDRDKDVEILALRHQITVLERQLGTTRPRLLPSDRAFLAALLHRLPRDVLGRFRLLVRPETVLRWHRDLLARRHAAMSRPRRPGRPRTVRSIRLLVLRLARENDSWGYRRIHGELLVLGIKIAASTVWEILRDTGIDPAPQRTSTTWASFLRSQADVLLACDFFGVSFSLCGYGGAAPAAASVTAARALMSSAATGTGSPLAGAGCVPGGQRAGAAVACCPAGARPARACRRAVTPPRASTPNPSGNASARACRAA